VPRVDRVDLSRVPRVDAVGVEERAAALAKRSIKKEAKRAGIRLAIRMIDLTTLEGKDSEEVSGCAAGAPRSRSPGVGPWRRSASTRTSSRSPCSGSAARP
jgi:hypothetical protein